jgi:hypothetical protein
VRCREPIPAFHIFFHRCAVRHAGVWLLLMDSVFIVALIPPCKRILHGGMVDYCGGLVVLGRGVVVPERGTVLGRGAVGGPPAAGCAGTPDFAL